MSWLQTRKRRGLTTVITSAIMMSAVVILGSAGVVWSQTSLNSQQVEMANSVGDYINKLNESLVYEYVYCSDDPCGTVIVVLTNVGEVGLDVSQISISDKISGFNKIHPVSSGSIMPDNSIVVSINDPSFSSYSVLDVMVETSRGNIIQTQIST
jgi:archaellum component FlaF (FlaF/FlaG flagellin family)